MKVFEFLFFVMYAGWVLLARVYMDICDEIASTIDKFIAKIEDKFLGGQ